MDPRTQLRPSQLALIGAVTILWNYVEWLLDEAVAASLRITNDMEVEVTSRINGIDGKIAILKRSARLDYQLAEPDCAAIAATLGAVAECKRYRDGIVHAKIISPDSAVAPTAQRKGITDEVLVSEEALRHLYTRLMALQEEMLWLSQAFLLLNFRYHRKGVTDTDRQRAEQIYPKSLAQLRTSQKNRLNLPPLPKFPEESKLMLGKEAPPGAT